MQNVVIIGATSAIAKEVGRIHAERGSSLYLLARDEAKLPVLSNDLAVRGSPVVHTKTLDVNNVGEHESTLKEAFEEMGRVDQVLIAHGTLPDQSACQNDAETTLNEIHTNAISTVSLLTHLANLFEKQKFGTIAVITSVAGDRGRQSNYVYGSAKGMITIFLQGLRNRLHRCNVAVLDIKPGFVDTPMTAAFDKGPLWAKPDQVAKAIVNAVDCQKSSLYTPFFWWPIMLIIRNIPEAIFKRLAL